MKVTFCAYDAPGYVGGPNAWLKRLLPELRTYGVDSRVLALTSSRDDCPTVSSLRQQGFTCSEVVQPEFTGQQMKWLFEELMKDPPDVFVPNLMVPAFYLGRWIRAAGIPTVGVLHSDDPFHRALQDEFIFGDTDYQLSATVCVSRFLEQEVRRRQPRRTLVKRIPCGVPVPERTTHYPDGNFRLVYVGRLVEEQKRISDVVRSLCQVVREVPKTEAVIYGDGSARHEVEKILNDYGRGLPIYLAGRVDSNRVQEELLTCHALVLLSDYEGLPIALMEAMACGVVPVCLNIRSGMPELIEHMKTGMLVENRGDDFVKAVRLLRDEPTLWSKLSSFARNKIQTEYSNSACAAQWNSLLREVRQQPVLQQTMATPRRFDLPPIHPDLAREDYRKLPAHRMFVRDMRRLASYVKHRL